MNSSFRAQDTHDAALHLSHQTCLLLVINYYCQVVLLLLYLRPINTQAYQEQQHSHWQYYRSFLSLSLHTPLRHWTGKATPCSYKYFIADSILNRGWKERKKDCSLNFTFPPLVIAFFLFFLLCISLSHMYTLMHDCCVW